MASIIVDTNIKSVVRELTDIQHNQVPFATSLALDALAASTKKATETAIKRNLDRPTRYAQNMLFAKSSTKRNLTATVGAKDNATVTKRGAVGPDKILEHLFIGGQRRGKGYEGLLIANGLMPKGYYTVPGDGVTLDAYGNIPRGLIIQLISYFGAFNESGYKANATDESRYKIDAQGRRKVKVAQRSEYFVVKVKKPGGLAMGIWQRITFGSGKGIRPIIIYVKNTQYSKLIDLPVIASKVIQEDAEYEFDRAMSKALASAK